MREFDHLRLIGILTREPVFIRHDVDYSIRAALRMAELEHTLGISANYYLMTDSPFYFAEEAFAASVVLAQMEHTVGWHVDPRRIDPSVFARSARFPVLVSFHCPRETELWRRFPGADSAYDPIWEGLYYADSRGRFSHGDPEDHDARQTIQVNLHPEWWFEPDWHEAVDPDVYESFWHEPKELLSQP